MSLIRKVILSIYKVYFTSLSRLSKKKNFMIFESNPEMSDNTRALYDEIIAQRLDESYSLLWIVKQDKGLPGTVLYNDTSFIQRMISEFKINRLLAKSKFYFFSHINYARFIPSEKQCFFNLTHGTPLKDASGRHQSLDFSTFLLTPSDFSGALSIATYQSNAVNKIKVLGFPRNDLLLRTNEAAATFINQFRENNETKVFVWMPTFRRHQAGTTDDSGKKTSGQDIPLLESVNDWHEFDRFLDSQNMVVILKPHPAQNLDFFSFEDSKRIKYMNDDLLKQNQIQLYEFLAETDGLITDYSSVYFDYLLTNKPIIFTVDDFLAYQENVGFVFEDPLKYMPGAKVESKEALESVLIDLRNDSDGFINERTLMNKKFNEFHDDGASIRILKSLNL